MSDPTVREVRGASSSCYSAGQHMAVLSEGGFAIRIDLGSYTSMSFSAEDARSLARDLYRLARRVQARTSVEST